MELSRLRAAAAAGRTRGCTQSSPKQLQRSSCKSEREKSSNEVIDHRFAANTRRFVFVLPRACPSAASSADLKL